MMHSRATNPADKEQRRETILDAAERLWLGTPLRVASMAEIATAAGLAKGTVYLYFRSKEELFLAIHERHVAEFFERVRTRAQHREPMSFDDMFAIKRQFLADIPAFLPLASLCQGWMERHIALAIGYAFQERTYAHLDNVVTDLKPHFPGISQALMLQSYGLILGLWQLLRPTPLKDLMKQKSAHWVGADDYLAMLETALRALWRGTLTHEEQDSA